MNWTAEQRRILDHPPGHHAVVRAAPGAGKTTTLVGRVCRLLERGASPRRIRVVMFNRSIQQTFEARLADAGVRGVRVTTFDALGLEVLRVAEREGLLRGPLTVVPEGTAIWAREVFRGFRDHFDSPTEIADAAAFWKAHLIPPSRAAFRSNPPLVEAYRALEAVRLADGQLRVAFEDMVYTAAGVLGAHPRLLGELDHVLVDEFQDVNPGRVALLQRLIGPDTALMAVGDEDQGINEWCGAQLRFFSEFSSIFPNLPTRDYPLSQSFRFGPTLASAATRLIGHNGRPSRRAIQGRGATEGAVTEVPDVPDAVASLLDEGFSPADLAILYRGRTQGAPVLAGLAAAGVPMLTDDMGMLTRGRGPELALGYLRYATSTAPVVPEEAWPVLHAPDRYVQRELMFDLIRAEGGRGLVPLLSDIDASSGLNPGAVRVLRALGAMLQKMRRAPTAGEALDLLQAEVDIEAQLRGWLRSERDQETAIAAFHATHALLRGLSATPASAMETLRNLDPRAGAAPEDCIWASTIHKAKGMEWRVVLLPGLLEGACPAVQVGKVPGTVEHPDGVPQSPWIEQERRIFYVGLTRGIEAVYLHAPAEAPSRFVAELKGARFAPAAAALGARDRTTAVVRRGQGEHAEGRGKSWSEAQDQELMEGWEEGYTVEDLAERLKRSGRGVSARLVRLGLVSSRAEARSRV